MRKWVAILIAMVLLIGCASQVPLTQSPLPGKIVVGHFDFSMEALEPSEYESEAQGLIPDIIRAYQAVKTAKEAYQTYKSPDSSPEKALLDSLYSIFETNMRQRLHLNLLPVQTLKGTVRYNAFGYPLGNCKKLAATGKFNAVLKVTAFLSFPQRKSTSTNLLVKGKVVDKFKPKLELHVQMYDRQGKVIWNRNVSAKSPTYLVLTRKYLLGMETEETLESVSIPTLFRKAVEKLVAEP